ncbi:hypothetical protein [Sulfuritalea hydrogenivorans]|jgi:hypothetical protein|nr:hypothetical protein [Sulfuritalea hydrogenivorans]MDK9713231.1 hypothetical protein [Sulfuritalea sp.]
MQSSDRAFVACKNAAPVRGGVFIFAGSRHEMLQIAINRIASVM